MKTLIALIALLVSAAAWSAQVVDVKFKALDGFGGDTGSIASRCQTKKGQEYDPATLTRDVSALKDSSEFEDISADAQRVNDGVEITFFVKRKMRYSAPATVKGANAFSASKVLKEAELKVGYLYGEADLAEAAEGNDLHAFFVISRCTRSLRLLLAGRVFLLFAFRLWRGLLFRVLCRSAALFLYFCGGIFRLIGFLFCHIFSFLAKRSKTSAK